ncbi:pentatricopeptide repeat-containing protein At4g39530-like [Nymphaea colorata]|uniref:pentatricopeptide repeat-containing protein At4g39530-like n=1 Tax=Nymphaea colorata TaxID=210225 RepID=UPI00129E4A13|nr:pentatricopeptide repeat-containing protein At4g39530-like [Nymphaea colorata]XP_031489823.1 pentatricopeptide repeat-containing protein At4g39530-like [Nymphaea colorata]XP_031489824.1 pentatricopeptide repeat-containing protein At4g39530-like [Nymphaea colorata]XP_049934590.1 pentatricopeptide repeat-containing protein At4g39530-like [Nymphaea colorata]
MKHVGSARKYASFCNVINSEDGYAHLIRVCSQNQTISIGKALHCHLLKSVRTPRIFIFNCLAKMYIEFGCINDACQLFDEMPQRDAVSWNTMICGLVRHGLNTSAFTYFRSVIRSGRLKPDGISYSSVLRACNGFGGYGEGLMVHCMLIKQGFEENLCIGSSLVDFYTRCHESDEAIKVFDRLVEKDTVLINTMISLHIRNGDFGQALMKFRQIMSNSWIPTRVSFTSLLNIFNTHERVKFVGMSIHGLIIKFGLEGNDMVQNGLVVMYATPHNFENAVSLLYQSGTLNPLSSTSLIAGYISYGCFDEAMVLFWQLHSEGVEKDSIMLSCVLNACSRAGCIQLGTQIHSLTVRLGHNSDSCVCDSLVSMYGSSSFINHAEQVFYEVNGLHDILSWTVLLSVYVQNELPMEALKIFYEMQNDGVKPDSVACINVLGGYNNLGDVDHFKKIHGYIIKSGCTCEEFVETSLLHLYADAGYLDFAFQLFYEMAVHDVVSWSALISSCTDLGYGDVALLLLVEMMRQGVKPNEFTFASTLCACTKVASFQTGRSLHGQIVKTGLKGSKIVDSSVIDLYAKCGSMSDVKCFFEETEKNDVVIWNSVIGGYAYHGNGTEVLKSFHEMSYLHGIEPDQITFLAVLSGCSHNGLIENVSKVFVDMVDEYKIEPRQEHFACVIGAFGRAGMFRVALEFLKKIRKEPEITVLRTLLSCCSLHGNHQLGLAVAGKIFKTCQDDNTSYVLLSGIYARIGRWKEAENVREVMKRRFVAKDAGRSWIG